MKNLSHAIGQHALIDFYGVAHNLLNDIDFIREMMLQAATNANCNIINDCFSKLNPVGITGVVIIAESHISIHTWPEYSYCAVDYFTSNKSADIALVIDYFNKRLSPKHSHSRLMLRGTAMSDKGDPMPTKNPLNNPELYFAEYYSESNNPDSILLGSQYLITRELFNNRSKFQEIRLFENPTWGKVLALDGMVMTTEKDDYAYHEMLAHVPIIIHGDVKKVMIAGGGDGGLLREVLRHPGVERVDLVEIDSMVIELSKQHLQFNEAAFNDRRVFIHTVDAASFVRDKDSIYDIIFVDATEPHGLGEALYTISFYKNCQKALKDNGFFAAQALSAWLHEKEQRYMFKQLRSIWPIVLPYITNVPTYPGGLWTFALCGSRNFSPEDFDVNYANSITKECRYYNTSIHNSSFCLPNFLQQKLAS